MMRVEPASLLSGMLAKPRFEGMWSGAKETAAPQPSEQQPNAMFLMPGPGGGGAYSWQQVGNADWNLFPNPTFAEF